VAAAAGKAAVHLVCCGPGSTHQEVQSIVDKASGSGLLAGVAAVRFSEMPCASEQLGSIGWKVTHGRGEHAVQTHRVAPASAISFRDKLNGDGCAAVAVAGRCAGGGSEIANVWLESILRADSAGPSGGAVSAATMRSFALQNKNRLHEIIVGLGLARFSPKVYCTAYSWNCSSAAVPATEFPVVIKALRMTDSKGIYIARTAREFDAHINASTRSGAEFLVEEAVVAPTEFVYHYMRSQRFDAGRGHYWCGEYRTPGQESGMFVKGVLRRNATNDERVLYGVPCDPQVIDVMVTVMDAEGVDGMGCINFKYAGGQAKIFDWNLRQCGSMITAIRLAELLGPPGTANHALVLNSTSGTV
jgi:hypothetical protein